MLTQKVLVKTSKNLSHRKTNTHYKLFLTKVSNWFSVALYNNNNNNKNNYFNFVKNILHIDIQCKHKYRKKKSTSPRLITLYIINPGEYSTKRTLKYI